MNAPHVSDRGRLHVVQNLSRVTTIHKIWKQVDHGCYCSKNDRVDILHENKDKINSNIYKQEAEKQTSRRVPANCSEEHSRFPLDTVHLAPPAAVERVARQRPKIRSTHAGLVAWLVCKAHERGTYPTKTVPFEGREARRCEWG